jgi:hypothetical protein
MGTGDKPRYLIAAEALAKKWHTTAGEILHVDHKASSEPGYPGPDCLLPHEVEALSLGSGLKAGRADHLAGCAVCASLVDAAVTDPVEIEAIWALVRERQEPATAGSASEAERGRSAGKRVAWLSALAALAMMALTVCWQALSQRARGESADLRADGTPGSSGILASSLPRLAGQKAVDAERSIHRR